MQKRNLGKIRRRPPVIIRNLIPILISINPAFRNKRITVFAPEDRCAVDSVRAQDEACSAGNVFAGDGCVADGFADCGGDGWVEAEDFLADAVQEREGFEVCVGYGCCGGGDFCADFGAEAGLDFWVQG
jgi:hypothetical protein